MIRRQFFNGWGENDIATKYLTWPKHCRIADTDEYVREVVEDKDPEAKLWVMTREAQVIGSIRLGFNGHKADIVYVLSPQYWVKAT